MSDDNHAMSVETGHSEQGRNERRHQKYLNATECKMPLLYSFSRLSLVALRYVSLQTGQYEAGFEQCYAFLANKPLLVITYFTAPWPAGTGSNGIRR